MSTLYKENILDHYKNPRNFKKPNSFTHKAFLDNVTCGDEMEVFLKIEEDIIKEISFEARGCAISIAAMSMLSEKLKGEKISEVKKFTDDYVLKMLGMQKETPRVKCALLGVRTLRKALSS
jgi:nitrogen fixation protein NifU and related proteins